MKNAHFYFWIFLEKYFTLKGCSDPTIWPHYNPQGISKFSEKHKIQPVFWNTASGEAAMTSVKSDLLFVCPG